MATSPIKRGYSREFTPKDGTGKRYLVDKIPAGLWRDLRAKAKQERKSIRALTLTLWKKWVEQ
jgi:hypothetical protein